MSTVLKVAAVAALAAVVGGFFVGRTVAERAPLPDVREPVVISPAARSTPAGTPATDRPTGAPTVGGGADEGDDDPGRGRGRGRGRGGDQDDDGGGDDGSGRGEGETDDDSGHGSDDVRTVEPSPFEVGDDDGGDDGGDDDNGGDDDGPGDD
jgi:hypothetical protein